MKKTFIAIFSILLFCLQADAQQWLTVKGGGGLALANGYDGATGGLSINSGLGYKHHLTNRIVAEGNILLDTRAMLFPNGFDSDGNTTYFAGGGTYIQVPLTAHLILPIKNRKKLIPYRTKEYKSYFYLEGGPYVSYALAVTNYFDPLILAGFAGTDSPIDVSSKKIDVGVTTGFGINFSIKEGKNRLILGTRANYGLLNIYKDERLGNTTNLSLVGFLALDFDLTKGKKHFQHAY